MVCRFLVKKKQEGWEEKHTQVQLGLQMVPQRLLLPPLAPALPTASPTGPGRPEGDPGAVPRAWSTAAAPGVP